MHGRQGRRQVARLRSAWRGGRAPATAALMLALLATSVEISRAATPVSNTLSVTLMPATVGLSIASAGTTCTVTTATTCALAQPVTVTVSKSSKQKIYFLPLAGYQTRDATGSGRGWHVNFQATRFTSATDSLPAGSLYLARPGVACAPGVRCVGTSAPPRICGGTGASCSQVWPAPIDTATGITVASAATATGMGVYTFTPGTLACPPAPACFNRSGGPGASGNLELYVEPSAKGGVYSSTLTESIIAGP